MYFKQEFCKDLSDKEAVKKALLDVNFFTCIIVKYEQRLLSYIHKLSGCDTAEAEDILQESFIKVWKNLHAYKPYLTFENWIFRIVHNETISFYRKKTSYSKDKRVDLSDEKSGEWGENDFGEHSMEELPYRLIENVLPKLKLEYREVLILKFMEGKSYEEISDILKIPTGTVATRINRAKKSFQTFAADNPDYNIFKK